jgi:hypothetical protein
LSLCAVACGKKGPPLPPLVKLPAAPANLTAARRADTVVVQLTVPAANTDSSRPANVARVDIYALTGPAAVSEADILKKGTRVASIAVKAPRDPDATIDPDDPEESEADLEPPQGKGLDQGAVARIQEPVPPAGTTAPGTAPATPVVRSYVGVGITTKGRRGPSSKPATVPLVPPPPAPAMPAVAYSETAVTVSWPAGPASRYNVYEVSDSSETPLTKAPIADPQYTDTRMTWGAHRCYAVRAVATIETFTVESEPTPPVCVTLVDTFAPAPPKGLQAVATEGAINLIWDPNGETDLDGYVLLRGAPGETLQPIVPAPIHETAFQDRVPSGTTYAYAVVAADKAGNRSQPSERIEETAR